MDRQEFLKQQQEATERLRRMHERSKITEAPHTMPPTPSFLHLSQQQLSSEKQQPKETQSSHATENKNRVTPSSPTNTPHNAMHNNSFLPTDLATLLHDSDTTLILGLLLLLYSEHADQKLLLALLYILI